MLVRVANEKRFEARRGRWGLVVKGKMRGEREAWASYIVDHVGWTRKVKERSREGATGTGDTL